MIKISLVDDDPSDRSFLHSLVSDSFEKTGIDVEISEFESAEDFLSVFEPEIFDLCFLDIYMKKMNGMDAARQIRELDPELAIVFLTSSADYVYEGYEVQALRYLTKPPVPEKVHAVIDQFLAQTVLKNRRLAVSSGKQNYEVPYGKILYIMSVGNNIELHLKDTWYPPVRKTHFYKDHRTTAPGFPVHLMYPRRGRQSGSCKSTGKRSFSYG